MKQIRKVRIRSFKFLVDHDFNPNTIKSISLSSVNYKKKEFDHQENLENIENSTIFDSKSNPQIKEDNFDTINDNDNVKINKKFERESTTIR